MKNLFVITGLSVAIIAGGTSLLLANSDKMMSRGMHPSFEDVDADGDGKITQSEMQGHRAERFATADTDGNGSLSADEMMARMAKRMGKKFSHMIERFDTDGDGELSMEEMRKRHKGNMFSMMDADGDGGVSAEEFEAMRGMRGKHQGKGMSE